jgi:hypothetical protein
VLIDILNKAYSNFILIRDAKDTVDLFLKLNKARKDSISVSITV